MNKTMALPKKGFLHSPKAEKGAEQLIQAIKSGVMEKATLQNTSPNFTGELEQADFASFSKFLDSTNGHILFEQLEEEEN